MELFDIHFVWFGQVLEVSVIHTGGLRLPEQNSPWWIVRRPGLYRGKIARF